MLLQDSTASLGYDRHKEWTSRAPIVIVLASDHEPNTTGWKTR